MPAEDVVEELPLYRVISRALELGVADPALRNELARDVWSAPCETFDPVVLATIAWADENEGCAPRHGDGAQLSLAWGALGRLSELVPVAQRPLLDEDEEVSA